MSITAEQVINYLIDCRGALEYEVEDCKMEDFYQSDIDAAKEYYS